MNPVVEFALVFFLMGVIVGWTANNVVHDWIWPAEEDDDGPDNQSTAG